MWLYIPEPILARSQASARLISGSSECFGMLAQSATLRTTSLRPREWWSTYKTTGWMPRLFGATWRRSQQGYSEAIRTWLSEAFPVPTYPLQGDKQASTVHAQDSSLSYAASIQRQRPDTSSWKTSMTLREMDSISSSQSL